MRHWFSYACIPSELKAQSANFSNAWVRGDVRFEEDLEADALHFFSAESEVERHIHAQDECRLARTRVFVRTEEKIWIGGSCPSSI